MARPGLPGRADRSALLLGLLVLGAAMAGCAGDGGSGGGPSGTASPTPNAPVRFVNGTVAPSPAASSAPSLPPGNAPATQPTWGSVLTGHDGAEPTLGITAAGTLLTVALEKTLRSADGGKTWSVAFDLADAGPIPGRATSDPYLWVDGASGRAFTLHMVGIYCSHLAVSDDDGATWAGRDGACGSPVLDHLKLGSAPAPEGNPAAGAAFPSVLYQCYNTPVAFGFVFRCAMSYDGGETWPVVTSPFNRVEGSCSALGGVVAGRADGAAAMAGGYRCQDAHPVAVTTDGGLTWETSPGPGTLGAESMDPDLAFGPDGALWMAWRGDDQLLHLARSRDLAATWDGPWTVTPPGLGSTAFEAVAVRADGSVAVAFLATEAGGPPGEVGADAVWHLYATTWSPDGGEPGVAGFTSYRLTDTPVHVGGVCYVNQPCTSGGRNLLEFIDAQVAPDGTLHVAYTESCFGACDAGPAEQADDVRQVAVAWLRGW